MNTLDIFQSVWQSLAVAAFAGVLVGGFFTWIVYDLC